MSDFLFVYGTLRAGAENSWARLLRAEAERIGPATVRGSIFRVGVYPAYRPEPDGEVHGEVYRLPAAGNLLAKLDEYESPRFARLRILVSTGEYAWIYPYDTQRAPPGRIASGDFREA